MAEQKAEILFLHRDSPLIYSPKSSMRTIGTSKEVAILQTSSESEMPASGLVRKKIFHISSDNLAQLDKIRRRSPTYFSLERKREKSSVD